MMSLTSAALPDNSTEPSRPHRLMRMPLSPEQEILCERLEKGEPDPRATALIRQQAREIDDLWDGLSRAYALVRARVACRDDQDEIEQLRAMLDERQQLQMSG